VRAVLADDGVDVAVVGCVPLSGALDTLAPGGGHSEDVGRADSVANLICDAVAEQEKACIAVVDGGPLFDEMARVMEGRGVPTFRSADRALRVFEAFCASRR
jgi:hypothetical protein